MSNYPIPVSIASLTDLSTLDVTVNIVDSSDQFLGLTLVAPSGDTLTLVLNQVPVIGGTANTGIGLSGSNIGVKTYTTNNIPQYALGTTFDDNATRDIFDPNTGGTNANTAPYVGDYRPETFETLDQFLATELAKGAINGTWTLRLNDTNKPPTTPPATPNYIVNWSLSFGRGLTADNSVVVPGSGGIVVPGAVTDTYSTAAPSTPIGIGPGVVMAQDNTLGDFSNSRGGSTSRSSARSPIPSTTSRTPPTTRKSSCPTPTTTAGPGASRPRSTTIRPPRTATPRTPRISTTSSTAGASTSRRSPWTRPPGPWSCPGETPATTPRTPWSRPISPPASTAAIPSMSRTTPIPSDGDRRDHRPDRRPGPAGRQWHDHGQFRQRRLRIRHLDRAWPSTTDRSTRSGRATSTRPRWSTTYRPATPCPSSIGRWSSPPDRGSSTAPWGRSRMPRRPAAWSASRSLRPADQSARQHHHLIHRRRRPGLLQGLTNGDGPSPSR